MKAYSCLLIEDNTIVAESIALALRRQGLIVDHIKSAEDAFIKINHQGYDLILLDLVLPGMSGEEFIKSLRFSNNIPIIVISEKDSDVGKAISLELGADDYITKPISVVELVARINAVLRRVKPDVETTEWLEFGDLKINVDAHEVLKGNETLPLTVKEYDLLKLFFENPNNVLSKRQIYRKIWNEDLFGNENIINVHIRRLREKIEDDPNNPKIIETVWGVGYRLGKLE